MPRGKPQLLEWVPLPPRDVPFCSEDLCYAGHLWAVDKTPVGHCCSLWWQQLFLGVSFLKNVFIFREKGRKGEGEGEKHV